MWWPDELVLGLLAPLAVWVLLSGLDDVLLDLGSFWIWLRSRPWQGPAAPGPFETGPTPPLRIALMVPCWREAEVIGRMLARNLRSIEYARYDIWVGLYPNDEESIEQVRACAQSDSRVRYVVGRVPGPTTKADNLNEVLAGILAHERRTGRYYDLFLQHDAEDVIHPESLSAVARLAQRYDFIQIPVFPLATPVTEWVHGVYCDEFAESHMRDLIVRSYTGGFIPSAGVGTAVRRDVIDRLRISSGDRIFDSRSLTEDYFLGLQCWRMGLWQCFARLRSQVRDELIATRAFFPSTFVTAVKQRTRWIIGNSLQAWERFGWTGDPRQAYWLWRDRKSLVGHPVSALSNLIFVYGLAGAVASWTTGSAWGLGDAVSSRTWLLWLLAGNLSLFVWRQAMRATTTGRVYGWPMALTVPIRSVPANFINLAATTRALFIWGRARYFGAPLTWSKTAHAFPGAETGPHAAAPFALAPDGLPAMSALEDRRLVPAAGDDGVLLLAGTQTPMPEELQRIASLVGGPVRFQQVSEPELSALAARRREIEASRRKAAAG